MTWPRRVAIGAPAVLALVLALTHVGPLVCRTVTLDDIQRRLLLGVSMPLLLLAVAGAVWLNGPHPDDGPTQAVGPGTGNRGGLASPSSGRGLRKGYR